jgi:ubiquinone/menaquinone biosynthesis C-methylase UbiE
MKEPRPYLITFTDLIYAAWLSYALTVLHEAANNQTIGLVFIVFAIALGLYDWYGSHWAVIHRTGTIVTLLDFVALLVYFGLVFFGSKGSIYFMLLLAMRALRGIFFDILLLQKGNKPEEAARLKSWLISSGFMTATYLVIFGLASSKITLSSQEILVVSFVVWATAYASAEVAERIYGRNLMVWGKIQQQGRRVLQWAGDTLNSCRPSRESTLSPGQNYAAMNTDGSRFYDAVAEVLDRDYYGPNADPCLAFDVGEVWYLMEEEINPSDMVLEIGCGTGYWMERIGKEIGADTFGIDYSPRMVTIARQRGCSKVMLAEASRLPFKGGVFDKVISPFNALNHCPDYQEAFREIGRVLKESGSALLMVDNRNRLIRRYWHLSAPNVRSLSSDPRSGELWRHIVNGKEVRVFSHFFTIQDIVELLPVFRIYFRGIGMVMPLIPRILRQHRTVSRILVRLVGPVERFLGKVTPSRAAHLFIIARRKASSSYSQIYPGLRGG